MKPIEPLGAHPARFNLSEWALQHRSFVLFAIIVFAFIGVFAYERLGQSEDPPFTFKVMVIKTQWPGASARDVEQQVTDKIERKLQEVPDVDFVRSYSKPGESMVFFAIKDSAPSAQVPETWYQVRKKIGDIRGTLPSGIQGPFFNDEFGDTYTNIYAITGDGFEYRDLKDFGDRIRAELLRIPGVAKVDFIGEQEEKVFIELSNAKLATLGIEPQQILQTLSTQNAIAASGVFDTGTDRIFVRPTGVFDSLDAIADIAIRANDRVFRLGDIAHVYRGYVDPPQQKMRWRGHDALGLGITMARGGDVIELGHDLDREMKRIQAQLPVGIEVEPVTSMPKAVQRSVNQFVRSLAEAVVIVLLVSPYGASASTGPSSSGVDSRLGAGDHVGRIRLGRHRPAQDLARRADPLARPPRRRTAIIAVEMMAIKMGAGLRFASAPRSIRVHNTAFPNALTGTLVTGPRLLFRIADGTGAAPAKTRGSDFQVSADRALRVRGSSPSSVSPVSSGTRCCPNVEGKPGRRCGAPAGGADHRQAGGSHPHIADAGDEEAVTARRSTVACAR
jgi:multidrug efflux pump